jgi:integrase
MVRRCIDVSVDPGTRRIGELEMRDLTLDRVAAWSQANERVLAPTTASTALSTLSQVCRDALRRRWLADNPVGRLKSGEQPRREPKRTAILEGAELALLLVHADTYRPLFELSAFTGLRIGEALGLRWCDIDLDCRVLRVEQQLGRHRLPKRLKTPAAKRQVLLADPVVTLLRQQQIVWPDRNGDDLVFCTDSGQPYAHNAAGDAFRRSLQRAGLRDHRRLCLHSLRHSYASLLIGGGLNVVFVSRQLGHANANITLGTYAHLYGQADHEHTARAALETSHVAVSKSILAIPTVASMETVVETEASDDRFQKEEGTPEGPL